MRYLIIIVLFYGLCSTCSTYPDGTRPSFESTKEFFNDTLKTDTLNLNQDRDETK